MAKRPKFKITPIGGLGEIGKNMTLFELGRDGFLIDCGIMFPANDMHGVDYIIPDFRWLQERNDIRLHGVCFTHGHEDHIGAVSHLIKAFSRSPAIRHTTNERLAASQAEKCAAAEDDRSPHF